MTMINKTKKQNMFQFHLCLIVLIIGIHTCLSFSCRSYEIRRISERTTIPNKLYAIIGSDENDGGSGKDVNNKNNNNDFIPLEEQSAEYTGSVDWDAEWKKVMKNKENLSTQNRPGKDFYKSEAEIAAIRAANKATEETLRLAAKVPSLPSWDMVKGDWRFWVGILVVLSVGTSLLSGAATQSTVLPNNADPSSYYI